MRRHPRRPVLESIEGRIAMSASIVPGDVGAQVEPLLQAYSDAYPSHRGQPRYNPQVDTNHNGQVGQGDARALLRAVSAPVTRDVPLKIEINLLPGEQVTGPHPKNSGGVTRKREVTIVGHTTPNSIVFLDNPIGVLATTTAIKNAGRFKFDGGALPTDSKGFFSFTLKLPDLLTQTEYLDYDPFGHQAIFAFPILRLSK
jgi:hypothetical protein